MKHLNIKDSLCFTEESATVDCRMRAYNEQGRMIDECRRATPFILDGEDLHDGLWVCGGTNAFTAHRLQAQSLLVPRTRLQAFGYEDVPEGQDVFHVTPKVAPSANWLDRFSRGDGKRTKEDSYTVEPVGDLFKALIDAAIYTGISPILGLTALRKEEALILVEKRGWLRLSASLLLEAALDIKKEDNVRFLSKAVIPIEQDEAELMLFQSLCGSRRHVAMSIGRVDFSKRVPVRVHSVCLTGDTLGSLRCDCGVQLEEAIRYLTKHSGILLYMDQEGRGIGLPNKLRAYALQDCHGLDTVDSNLHQGLPEDARSYKEAADMLRYLGVGEIALLTNNPNKVQALRDLGINVGEYIPHHFPDNAHNRGYLDVKKKKMGHRF